MLENGMSAIPAAETAEFTEFYRRFHPRLFSTAMGLVRNPEVAEDVVSEAFLRAWRGFGTFRKEASFGTWIHRILLNAVYDLAGKTTEELSFEVESPAVRGPEATVESREVWARIDGAVGRLSPPERQVFLMRELDGKRHAEIAASLGIAEGTSKVHYFHAVRKLREELHDLQ